MIETAIALGSNLGDRRLNIETALGQLEQRTGLTIKQVSSLYETAPWGDIDQPSFLNACVLIETTLSPHDLLALCLGIESDMGRVRDRRWGPRLIDLDVLFHGETAITSETLRLPHPEIQNRAFVLAPLAEIAPDFVLRGRPIIEHLSAIDAQGVVRLD